MTTLALRNVEKDFGKFQVIRGVDLDIQSGEFVVFVGPSGCGKSTLLRLIAGLEPITGGELKIAGERMNETPAAERGIAMVFQSYALYPHMSVYKNMSFGLETLGMPRDEIDRRVRVAAETLQIAHLLDRKPKQLSGGQRQRVAIGRSIVREPKIFLFDEPLSNLDAELRAQTRVEIAKLHANIGATMIYVTHDQVEAMTLADRIVVLRGGVVEQQGSPLEIYNHPVSKFVAGFIGSPKMNFFDVHVSSDPGTRPEINLAENRIALAQQVPLASGQALCLGVRPEHLFVRDDHQSRSEPAERVTLGECTVSHVEHLGGQTIIYGHLADQQPLTVALTGQHDIAAGEKLNIEAAPENFHLFDEAGLRLGEK